MANEKFTQLPNVANSTLLDIIAAVQSGVSVQQTLGQVFSLMLSNIILHYAGNPNSNVAGTEYQYCWDTSDNILYICTTTGNTSTAVWTKVAQAATQVIPPSLGGTGVADPTAHTLPIAEGSSNYNFLGPLTNGQLLIGSTGGDPVAAALTPGTNITITNTPGGIQIAASGAGGFTWNHVTGTSQAMSSNNGYITDNASLITLTLPTTSSIGDEIEIIGNGAGGWLIAQNSGQQIKFGNASTTSGVSGSLASTNQYDSVYLVCTVANTQWTIGSAPQGILTIV